MKQKWPKMILEMCTRPVGSECTCGCQSEAETDIFHTFQEVCMVKLMLLETSKDEHPLCWCGFDQQNNMRIFFNLFETDPQPVGLPQSGHSLEDGEYFRRGNNIYIVCLDKELGQCVKQLTIFASTADAEAAYRLSESWENVKKSGDFPEFHLVKLMDISDPNKLVCISWFIFREKGLMLLPIFAEDYPEYKRHDVNNLNWEFLDTGDTFWKDEKKYRVCQDEHENYYISLMLTTSLHLP